MAQQHLSGYTYVRTGEDVIFGNLSHRVYLLHYDGSMTMVCGQWVPHRFERQNGVPANFTLTCIACAARSS